MFSSNRQRKLFRILQRRSRGSPICLSLLRLYFVLCCFNFFQALKFEMSNTWFVAGISLILSYFLFFRFFFGAHSEITCNWQIGALIWARYSASRWNRKLFWWSLVLMILSSLSPANTQWIFTISAHKKNQFSTFSKMIHFTLVFFLLLFFSSRVYFDETFFTVCVFAFSLLFDAVCLFYFFMCDIYCQIQSFFAFLSSHSIFWICVLQKKTMYFIEWQWLHIMSITKSNYCWIFCPKIVENGSKNPMENTQNIFYFSSEFFFLFGSIGDYFGLQFTQIMMIFSLLFDSSVACQRTTTYEST